jgi:hypothetical protein
MKYVCVTNIDAGTGILCTEAPMSTGPAFPAVGFKYSWSNESTWPIECTPEGAYAVAPKYYGTCDDDADTTAVGVLEVLTEADWLQRKRDEFYARQPFASWVFDEASLQWNPPVPMPQDGNQYRWDEATTSWVAVA